MPKFLKPIVGLGEKATLVRLAFWQSFWLAIGAIIAVVFRPDAGTHITGILGYVAGTQIVGLGSFNAANAFITGKTAHKELSVTPGKTEHDP